MKKILDILSEKLEKAFEECGYDKVYGKVGISNRPDLCEYQCNGAMALAKLHKKKPIDIANEIVLKLVSDKLFEKIEAVMPGFININLSDEALTNYIKEMSLNKKFGLNTFQSKKIIIDYGGANVAKPLHIGHLRSAVIGESLKRIGLYMGNEMIGDVHLGDWGLQMGLVIEELRERKPDLVYFDESYKGEYPKEPPLSISELEEMYPNASKRSKEDEAFKERAAKATYELQTGNKAYRAIWEHILNVSKTDLKKNYDSLDVHFELWKGESDAQKYIPDMIKDLEDRKIAYTSNKALVVDIAKESDTKELPPCIIRKSDGAALYATSDLGTLVEREKDFNPDSYIYIADKRQELHYTQFFRVANKAGIVSEDKGLSFIGFGTMNGTDGKPFKTRDGGVMRLENLISDIENAVYEKIIENRDISKDEALSTAKIVGLSAIKYGDLSNQASKDYIFDIERFISFEGNTGPYILYTIVRINSILAKYKESLGLEVNVVKSKDIYEYPSLNYEYNVDTSKLLNSSSDVEKKLKLELSKFLDVIEGSWKEFAPHRICQYIYAVANAFNSFYHEVNILREEDISKKESYLALIDITKVILEDCIWMLGITAPKKM